MRGGIRRTLIFAEDAFAICMPRAETSRQPANRLHSATYLTRIGQSAINGDSAQPQNGSIARDMLLFSARARGARAGRGGKSGVYPLFLPTRARRSRVRSGR